ncbi:MAG: protein-disulfide reductase DsbD family protein, partial [Asticcacaulis sp.]
MKRWWLILLCLLSLSLPVTVSAADRAKLGHTEASLSAQYSRTDGKGAFWVLFRLDIEKGWHTYWQNPGDSGLAPSLDWTLPEGFAASDIVWQPPERQPFGPLMNYGYSHASYHLVKITPREGFQGTRIPLKVSASWLVCAEECVPEEAVLDLSLPVGSHQRSAQAGEIDRLLTSAQLPVL